MTSRTKQTIYRDALDKWGRDAQIMMFIEECGEAYQGDRPLPEPDFGTRTQWRL